MIIGGEAAADLKGEPMKKKAKGKLIAAIAICTAVFCALFFFFQALLVPKYVSENPEGSMISEYYDNYGDNDVIFIGDCEVYENISPITLWEEYGITSYIRGTAQQLMWQSYYILEETLTYETPKVVVLSVLAMMYGDPDSTGDQDNREAYNRMTLDNMKWSVMKWKCIKASLTVEEKEADAMWTYIFPLLRFHDRWSELTMEDLVYVFKDKEELTDNGYLMQVGVLPVTDDYVTAPLVDYTFSDTCYYYLDKIRELCEENDIQLVLFKAPSLSPVWHDEWEEQIEDYAEEYGLYYINALEYIDEIGIDWDEDTYDRGLHLNVYGAEKLSSYLGAILMEECDIEDRRDEEDTAQVWEQKVETYNARKLALEAEEAAEEQEE